MVLRSPEEEREILDRERKLRIREEEDRRKLELIERVEKKNERLQGSQPYYERFQTGLHGVRNYSPNAPSRFLRLRALSDFLLLAAYLVAMLVLVGAGMTIYLKVVGVLASHAVLLLCLVGWAILGTVLFLGLKLLGELTFLLAELGDHQNDLVQLLLDLRDNTDKVDPA